MIYILSDEYDISTQHVASWLYFYKKPFIILNSNTKIIEIKIIISNELVKLKFSTEFDFFEIDPYRDHFYYRRGFLKFHAFSLINP